MGKNNEVDSFLEGLNDSPNDNPLDTKADENIFPEKEGESPEAVVEKEEKPLPFNKDPKVLKFIEKEIGKRMADSKPSETERFAQESSRSEEEQDEILASLTEIVGNDTPQKVSAVNRLRKALAGSEERSVKRAMEEIQNLSIREQQATTQAELEAENELSDGFDRIESEFSVDLTSDTPQAKKLRGDFIDFIERIAPKDSDGQVVDYPDFEETFKLFNTTRKSTSNVRAKELASRGMTRSTDASSITPTGGKSWKDIDKIFSKFGN